MILSNPHFCPSESVCEELSPFRVLLSDGTVGELPSIDSSLNAQDFNYSVQISLGANMSFTSSYIPSDKMADFEGLVSQADSLISDEIIVEPQPSVNNEN